MLKRTCRTKAAKSRVAYKRTIKKFGKPTKPKIGFVAINGTKVRHGQSKSEEIWLNNLGIQERSKVIYGFNGKIYVVDGYDSKTKTCFEYLGNFYHAYPPMYRKIFDTVNPVTKTTYRQLYEGTKARFNLFHSLGFRVIYCWEEEFKKNKFAQRVYIPGKELY